MLYIRYCSAYGADADIGHSCYAPHDWRVNGLVQRGPFAIKGIVWAACGTNCGSDQCPGPAGTAKKPAIQYLCSHAT